MDKPGMEIPLSAILKAVPLGLAAWAVLAGLGYLAWRLAGG
ncbi:MAG TPA: hypothetical protein VF731_01730 [Solirubrobacterales bacterium]